MLKASTQQMIRVILDAAHQANPGILDEAIADFDREYPIPVVDFDAPPPACSLEIPLLTRNEECGKCGNAAHLHKNWPHHNPKHPNYRPEFNR